MCGQCRRQTKASVRGQLETFPSLGLDFETEVEQRTQKLPESSLETEFEAHSSGRDTLPQPKQAADRRTHALLASVPSLLMPYGAHLDFGHYTQSQIQIFPLAHSQPEAEVIVAVVFILYHYDSQTGLKVILNPLS